MEKVTFADWLASELDRTGKTKTELAKHLGQSRPAISDYASGKKVPRQNRVEAMEEFFCTPDKLRWSLSQYQADRIEPFQQDLLINVTAAINELEYDELKLVADLVFGLRELNRTRKHGTKD